MNMDDRDENCCRVVLAARKTLKTGEDFARAVRRLQRETRACGECPYAPDCQVRIDLNLAIDGAIREVNRQWETRE
jgi:hypothetical protein